MTGRGLINPEFTISDTDLAAIGNTSTAASKSRLKGLLGQQLADAHALEEHDAHQRRAIYLNETVKDRMRMQNEMLWGVFWVIAFSVLLAALRAFLPESIFPHTFYMLLELGGIALGTMYVYVKYADYRRRDAIRFDEIRLAPPDSGGAGGKDADAEMQSKRTAALLGGDLSASVALKSCVGAQCCVDSLGLAFDPATGKCKKKSTD